MKSLLAEVSLPFAILLFCAAAACLYIAMQQDKHAQALIGAGQVAVAQLFDKTTFTSSGSHKYSNFGEKGPTSHTLHYRFTVPETGEPREASSEVHPEVWQAVQVGQHYQIVFSPTDSAVTSLFAGQEFVDGARLAYRIAGVCFVLGLLCAGAYWRVRE